jgi:ferredoxin
MKWFHKSDESIIVDPHPKPLKIGGKETVLDVALSNKLDISHTCGGMGSCTTCRVFVVEGDPGPRTDIEQERADERGFTKDERLACQLTPTPGLKLRLP